MYLKLRKKIDKLKYRYRNFINDSYILGFFVIVSYFSFSDFDLAIFLIALYLLLSRKK